MFWYILWLFMHGISDISFTLVVSDGFDMKWVDKADVHHLIK